MLYKDESGNEYEVFTAEEMEAKVEEAKNSAYEEALSSLEDSDVSEKLKKAETELAELKAKNQNMSGNLSGQRSVIEKKEEEVGTLKSQIEELAKNQREIMGQIKGESVKQKLSALVHDKDIRESAEKYFNDYFADRAKTDADIDKFVQDSIILASKGSVKVGSEIYSNTGNTPSYNVDRTGKLSEDGMKLAEGLGISEERLKKAKLI